MSPKPHFRLVGSEPIPAAQRETPVDAAKRRFGQKFAHEKGATWKPRQTPLLIEWLQKRGKA